MNKSNSNGNHQSSDYALNILRSWLEGEDEHIAKNPKWYEIGEEVYSRKTLLFAASSELEKKGFPNARRLAATDVFVEKAQKLLSSRAKYFVAAGILTSLLAISLLLIGAITIFKIELSSIFKGLIRDNLTLTVWIVKTSSASAMLLGAIYFLVALSKALLHEGTILYNRRHALRFVRLYVYLKEGEVDFTEMERVYKWNVEVNTAFKDIQEDKMTKTPLQKIVETPGDIATKTAEVAMNRQNKEKEGNKNTQEKYNLS